MERKLLVLDLDETLIYAAPAQLDHRPDFEIPPYFIYKRPHLDEFLAFCARTFQVAVWTSATEDYARAVIVAAFPVDYPLAFVFSRARCTRRYDWQGDDMVWIKDLKKLKRKGQDLCNIIMIEDSPVNLSRQYGNLVAVTPFIGNAEDRELCMLIDYLGFLQTVVDVRRSEKRNWRQHDRPRMTNGPPQVPEPRTPNEMK